MAKQICLRSTSCSNSKPEWRKCLDIPAAVYWQYDTARTWYFTLHNKKFSVFVQEYHSHRQYYKWCAILSLVYMRWKMCTICLQWKLQNQGRKLLDTAWTKVIQLYWLVPNFCKKIFHNRILITKNYAMNKYYNYVAIFHAWASKAVVTSYPGIILNLL